VLVEPRSINFTEKSSALDPVSKVNGDSAWNDEHHDEAHNEVGDVEPSKADDEEKEDTIVIKYSKKAILITTKIA